MSSSFGGEGPEHVSSEFSVPGVSTEVWIPFKKQVVHKGRDNPLESSGYSVLDKGSQRYVLAEWNNPVCLFSFGENSKRDTKKYLCSTIFLWTCKHCYHYLDSFSLNHQNSYFKFERADFLLPNR